MSNLLRKSEESEAGFKKTVGSASINGGARNGADNLFVKLIDNNIHHQSLANKNRLCSISIIVAFTIGSKYIYLL